MERYLDRPRHVEAQVLADTHGNVVVVGTRDCSLQRRHQKLLEEAPAPFLSEEQTTLIYDAAKAVCREAGYSGAGTVEFLVAADGTVAFLEVNTRLQVEHPITEETTGDRPRPGTVQDRRRRAAAARRGPRAARARLRIPAERRGRGPRLPALARHIGEFAGPTGPGIRLDTGVRSGSFVAPQFDSLLAKLIVTGADRQQALRRARRALAEMRITGVATVLPFHRAVLESPDFTSEDGAGHPHPLDRDRLRRQASPRTPTYSTTAPDGERRTITVEVDGRRLAVGLPADLLDGWARSIRTLSGGVTFGASDGGAAGRGADPAELRADMAGTVVKWLVEPGAEVSAGDPSLVLEAMKMETQVSAHRNGTVTDVRTEAGGVVAAGAVLALIG